MTTQSNRLLGKMAVLSLGMALLVLAGAGCGRQQEPAGGDVTVDQTGGAQDAGTSPEGDDAAIGNPGDFDYDSLSDEQEKQLGTDPKKFDTDDDGLNDGYEVNVSKTDPLKADTDGDGKNDSQELRAGSDPLKAD